MMTITLPEKISQIKTPASERVHPVDRDSVHSGIVFRFSSSGNVDVEILADQSDQEDTLRQRLTMVGPLLEMMQGIFTVEPLPDQTDGIRS